MLSGIIPSFRGVKSGLFPCIYPLKSGIIPGSSLQTCHTLWQTRNVPLHNLTHNERIKGISKRGERSNLDPSLRSAAEDLLITRRSLKRSVIKICSDTGLTDGSVRAFVVTSKDKQDV